MAKSKNGGTRSMLRGRVGSDVYSVGKDSQGKRQQVVRSLAEVVSNPQTQAQMKGRAIMSTVMQTVSALAQIIDHSFDNVAAGQPNVSEFIKRNYALIKADVEANPSGSNTFGIVKYGEKGAKQGQYVIAAGSAWLPSTLANAATKATLTVEGATLTVAAIKEALGLGENEYFTLVGLTSAGAAEIARFRIGATLSDETTVTASNIGDLFAIEANCTPSLTVNGMAIEIALPNAQANSAIIVSKFEDGAYKHNNATLLAVSAPDFTYDVAIATYPIGEARLLNGGNFNGGEHGGVTPTPPTPPVTTPQLTMAKIGVTDIMSGNVTVQRSELGVQFSYECENFPEGGTLLLKVDDGSSVVQLASLTEASSSKTISNQRDGVWGLYDGDTRLQALATITFQGSSSSGFDTGS
jgi:hypothetical protein